MAMATISYLTTVEFGEGVIAGLGAHIEALGIRRPLLVSDAGLVGAGLVERVQALLPPDRPATLFTDTPPNPTERAVLAALDLYRSRNCDGLVALGGGSPIDLAKAVALLATHPGPLASYALIEGGLERITADVARVIAIPTTAGTGAEVGRAALITLADGRKLALVSPHLIPARAVCDPELTYGLPPGLTAATGMDALSHCIETFLSPRFNPPAEAIALDGAARVGRFLERAVQGGSDREARAEMMMAALEGALAFQKGLGAVHAMSHPLGGIEELALHHGTLNAVVMPAVLRFNASHVGDKYDRLGSALGLAPATDLALWVEELNARLGLPPGLRAMGVGEAHLARAVAGAVRDHCTATNPRPPSASDYERLFREALG
jgi:4-hydroxybutyrate dehydrogenase